MRPSNAYNAIWQESEKFDSPRNRRRYLLSSIAKVSNGGYNAVVVDRLTTNDGLIVNADPLTMYEDDAIIIYKLI